MIIFLVIIIAFFIIVGLAFFALKSKKKDGPSNSSYEIGEKYEDKIYRQLNSIASNISVEHMPKGVKGPDFILNFKTESGRNYKIVVEVKNVKTYSLEWERKLNDFMLENDYRNKGIIVSTVDKNNRIPDNKIWDSEINKKIVIMHDDVLTSYALEQLESFEKDSVKKSKLTVSEQKILEKENINEDNRIKFVSIIKIIEKNFAQFLKKFVNINSNIKKLKKIDIDGDSKYSKINIDKIEDLSSQIEELTEELKDELNNIDM